MPHNHHYVSGSGSVAPSRWFPRAHTAGAAIGLARSAIGVGFFAAPVTALRVIGVDTATAARVSWLSRMTAARDAVLGAGTLRSVSADRGGASAWLLAGAVSDAVDAVVLVRAVQERRAGGLGAVAMVAAAAGTALLGVWAAAGLSRRR